jgi:3D (Asp-Asp-Asp) domain-containing protein
MSLSGIRTYHIFSLKQARKLIICLVVIFVFDFFFFSLPVLAANGSITSSGDGEVLNSFGNTDIGDSITGNYVADQSTGIESLIIKTDSQNNVVNNLPESPDKAVLDHGWHKITAYNSEASQCDAAPCITANGFNVCQHQIEDTIAANFLPFGAKVQIPDLFGDRIFIVRDRMSQKHPDRLDIWMNGRQAALNFGVKLAKINVLEP